MKGKTPVVGICAVLVVAAFAVAGIAVAGASSDYEVATYESDAGTVDVYKSASEPRVYGLEPITAEAAESIRGDLDKVEGSVTEGDLAYCEQAQERSDIDPVCAIMLEAQRDGELRTVPGGESISRSGSASEIIAQTDTSETGE